MNHRVQKYTQDGGFLGQWGRAGPVQYALGITVDNRGFWYVADWRNDRVQKLGPDGEFVLELTGDGSDRLKRPSGVAVDSDGLIYVTDWGNDRVVIFDAGGNVVARLTGDAGMSKWGAERLSSNPESMLEQRAAAPTLEPEKTVCAAHRRGN